MELKEMERPPGPDKLFCARCPSREELRGSARRKRNKATPGLNSITYVPYKKSEALRRLLHKLVQKIWTTGEVPADWAQAFIVLLAKSDELSNPTEFRPIAIASTSGKIFFSVVSDRLQTYMVVNGYIPREIQKGFLSGISGCVEHAFSLGEALKDANAHQKQIVQSWIDLANAYGSVRHNLIQFALEWYQVPMMIRSLIFNYYEQLMAKIETKEWSTGFFLFDIGLFQGCVLSTILFDCVFQLLLDFLKPMEKAGYQFKLVNIRRLTRAYADDLSLTSRDTDSNQAGLDRTVKWLDWTETMRAKPKKCVSLGFRKFDTRIQCENFVPVRDSIYSPFDPRLTIKGVPVGFILDRDNPDKFKGSHFKFLGRWFRYDLSEAGVKNRIRDSLKRYMELIEGSGLNGLMKLWIYQFYLLAKLSWPLLIQRLDMSFVKELERSIMTRLKKWAKVGRTTEVGALFRSKAHFGLGLTSLTMHYSLMQVVNCQLLKDSVDESIVTLFAEKTRYEGQLKRVWRATKLCTKADAEVLLVRRFPSQQGRQGLGAGNFVAEPSPALRRKLVSQVVRSFEEEKAMSHVATLAQQSVWTQWADTALPFDLSWQNLIYGPGPHVLGFVLNAPLNLVKTPKTWGYKTSARCTLCAAEQCTLHHILSACPSALKQKRHTWRHDSVLTH